MFVANNGHSESNISVKSLTSPSKSVKTSKTPSRYHTRTTLNTKINANFVMPIGGSV